MIMLTAADLRRLSCVATPHDDDAASGFSLTLGLQQTLSGHGPDAIILLPGHDVHGSIALQEQHLTVLQQPPLPC